MQTNNQNTEKSSMLLTTDKKEPDSENSLILMNENNFSEWVENSRRLGFIILEIKKTDDSNYNFAKKININNLRIEMNILRVEDEIIKSKVLLNSKLYKKITSEANLEVIRKYNIEKEITEDYAKSCMDEYLMSLVEGHEKWNIKYEIYRLIINKIHTYLWCDLLSSLGDFNIEGTLDLRYNNIQIIPDNFTDVVASKIDLRGNNLQQVPDNFKDMEGIILDYDAECRLLSQELQDKRKKFRIENPIKMTAIENYVPYPISLVRSSREDVGDVYRLFGFSYGSENLSDAEIMQIIINMHADGYDIHCNIKNNKLYKEYKKTNKHILELYYARLVDPLFRTDFSKFLSE